MSESAILLVLDRLSQFDHADGARSNAEKEAVARAIRWYRAERMAADVARLAQEAKEEKIILEAETVAA